MYCFCLEVGAKPLTKRFGFDIIAEYLGVAQFGRVLGSGPRGRRFKSSHSDHKKTENVLVLCFFIACMVVEPTASQGVNTGPRGNKRKTIRGIVFCAVSTAEQGESEGGNAARYDYANGEGRERFKSRKTDLFRQVGFSTKSTLASG